MQTLNAKNLSLTDVEHRFNMAERLGESFGDSLVLEPLTAFEHQEISQIQDDFLPYLKARKVSEGQVKFLVLAPLLRLAGFYQAPLSIQLEENIAEIVIEDEDAVIKGRMDILIVNKDQNPCFWALVIESKNSTVDVYEGLPQLLTYISKQLEQQSAVWGLVTNGRTYLFSHIYQGQPPTYSLLPELNLNYPDRLIELLQVLKAIAKL
jgi:Type I restriction enzyme R protein N terminus (HSDR_N)